MKSPSSLYRHKATGKVHKLLQVYIDNDEHHAKMAVTVQVNFISEPTATTDSWLGDTASFNKEFENIK